MRYLLPLFVCFLLLNLGIAHGQSQTCTGSLGDPIVNVDFGTGTSGVRGAPLSTTITNYTYTSGTPNDGFYTITQSTAGMYDWWSATDHTGNTGGYMMVVNASVSKSDKFYEQQVTGLCPGTTYEFAAWILNMAKTVKAATPNLTFKIQDATGTITLINTGDIPPGRNATDWVKYGILFTTPAAGGDITLTITNNGAGGTGNDIALDDITFRPCGPTIIPKFDLTNSFDAGGCAGTNQSYTMSAQVSAGYNTPMYQWQEFKNNAWVDIAGATNTTYTANFTPAVAGTYKYRMACANGSNINSPTCRVVSPELILTINAVPSVTAPSALTFCQGKDVSLTLQGGVAPGTTYVWTKNGGGYTPTSPNLIINNAQPADNGDYTVTVTNAAGCSATKTVNITITPMPTVAVSGDVSICQGDPTQLQATGSAGVTYSWLPVTGLSNPDIANPIAAPTSTTTYTVTVTSGTCTATASVTVTVIQLPVVTAGADQKMTEGQAITLDGSVSDPTATYYWTPATGLSDPNSLHPIATPTEDITYTLHATTGSPCNFAPTDDVFIRVYKKVVVPNTFTPNGDGVNDTWGIIALETYPESYTQVFNRFGTVVYQTRGYTKAWDGRFKGEPLPEGTYYYKIDLKPGTTLSGWVAILR
jgi:gliding motility-associated-like protein